MDLSFIIGLGAGNPRRRRGRNATQTKKKFSSGQTETKWIYLKQGVDNVVPRKTRFWGKIKNEMIFKSKKHSFFSFKDTQRLSRWVKTVKNKEQNLKNTFHHKPSGLTWKQAVVNQPKGKVKNFSECSGKPEQAQTVSLGN